MAELALTSPVGPFSAYLATPSGSGPWPGVVIIHDAFGMSTAAKRHADWLAGAGYLAATPNLFRLSGFIACVRAAFRELAAGKGPMFDDIEATRVALTKRPDCTGKVGVIGFCMGGGFAIALAQDHGFSASAPNYGRLPADAESYLTGPCPVVASYGGKDRSLRGAAARLETILTAKGVPHDVKEYPDAGHSFLDNHTSSELPMLYTLLSPLLGSGYHQPSAEDAQQRIVAFFDKHLKAPAGAA
jgi:carboxymethylenebutenolidase